LRLARAGRLLRAAHVHAHRQRVQVVLWVQVDLFGALLPRLAVGRTRALLACTSRLRRLLQVGGSGLLPLRLLHRLLHHQRFLLVEQGLQLVLVEFVEELFVENGDFGRLLLDLLLRLLDCSVCFLSFLRTTTLRLADAGPAALALLPNLCHASARHLRGLSLLLNVFSVSSTAWERLSGLWPLDSLARDFLRLKLSRRQLLLLLLLL
jgi:hypothetical protein